MVRKEKTRKDKKDGGKRAGRSTKIFVEESLIRELLSKGMKIEEMDGDGNCMFRSLAHQLQDDAEQHMKFRQQVLDYVENNKEHFQNFIEDDENFHVYVARLREFGEWGGNLELYAAAQCFHTNILIHQADAPNYMISGNDNQSKTNVVSRLIHLSFHGDSHYNSVVKVEGAVEVKTVVPPGQEVPQETIDLVSRYVPWVDLKAIRKALEAKNMDVDAAVELLCSDLSAVSLSADDHADADANKVEADPIAAVNDTELETKDDDQAKSCSPNASRKKGKGKVSEPTPLSNKVKIKVIKETRKSLSKKEQRKLEKKSVKGVMDRDDSSLAQSSTTIQYESIKEIIII